MRRIISFIGLLLVLFAVQCDTSNAQLTKLVVSITGSIFNEITKQPISIKMECFDSNGKRVYRGTSNASQNGYYYITGLRPGEKYFIRFSDIDFFRQDFEIDIPSTDKYAEFSRDFLVKPKEKGLHIPLKVPVFELGKSKLRAGADFFLKDILETMQKNPRVKFRIDCYPDDEKDIAGNTTMTQARCDALKEFFLKNGVENERLVVKASENVDPKNPPPSKKRAKGKRYIGPVYFVVEAF